MSGQPLILVVDGITTAVSDVTDALARAVIISLFTWRRANSDDDLPGTQKNGWWGDTYPQIDNDRIGSRLWLLSRAKLTTETVLRAKEYAEEALQWLIDDGIAADVQVQSERQDLFMLALGIKIIRGDQSSLNIRFANVWDIYNAV
jgi:phage gp46-like protein